MKTEWTAGTQHLKFLQPDIFLLEAGGPALLEEVKEVVRIMDEEVYPEVGNFFFFLRMNDASMGVTSDVRRFFGSIKPHWKAFVVIGGTAMMRAALSVAARAIKLIRSSSYDIFMVKTYEEACAVANRVRAKEEAKASNA